MSDNTKMLRVNKSTPCPVCGKPDWCLIAPDASAAICARIEDGSVKRVGYMFLETMAIIKPDNISLVILILLKILTDHQKTILTTMSISVNNSLPVKI